MKLSDFDFDLPEDLIATRPATPRSASRLLVVGPETQTDLVFDQIDQVLRPGDRLVLNDTKVIPARLTGMRHRHGDAGQTAAKIEVTLLSQLPDGTGWTALIKPLKKIKDGEAIVFSDTLHATCTGRSDGQAYLAFNLAGEEFEAEVARIGAMPLPPYIAAKRPADARDNEDYQTIWARALGAVAAPTASLHFDKPTLAKLGELGITFSFVTLHVGAGTFLPVKVDDISQHKMHSEWGEVSAKAAKEIAQTRAQGGRIICVGTTALRLVETAAREKGAITPWKGDTDIFITPGFQFKVADGLITNFHLPKSTLLMLVSAFMGLERMKSAYAHAILSGYRFFSYGDASILLPGRETT